ncbi:hypothetical protein E2C01_011723 [Portunus trituberculatus]|uniref:Uncharacterized protein n=1 Tax=Portunus trituberculatus TaxID=210409 RepID=A0A5B7DC84_PORTR|nr:hypothetical protein [Portunus trituberculatus]
MVQAAGRWSVEREIDAAGDPSTRQVIKPLSLLVPLRNSSAAAAPEKGFMFPQCAIECCGNH